MPSPAGRRQPTCVSWCAPIFVQQWTCRTAATCWHSRYCSRGVSMAERYGARPEAWDEWIALGAGSDLLPAVANPNAEMSPLSKMQGIVKTPSRYNPQRQVVGIPKWTRYSASDQELQRWKAEEDYSLSVILRSLGAIDVDVGDKAKASAIREAITSFLGPVPVRYRENSGKLL